MSEDKLAELRRDYSLLSLKRKDLEADPLKQFEKWMTEALNSDQLDPNACTLSTVDKEGMPSGRIVLLRAFDANGFVFYTNYLSHKGMDLELNNKASMNFFWPEPQRQIKVQGTVSKIPEADSDSYFASRPRESQLGAWASHQSNVLEKREDMMRELEELEARYTGQEIPRPPHWGGYSLSPVYMEFWQGRANRLHDRFCYEQADDGTWVINRLAP